jgi:hypothetical protein
MAATMKLTGFKGTRFREFKGREFRNLKYIVTARRSEISLTAVDQRCQFQTGMNKPTGHIS